VNNFREVWGMDGLCVSTREELVKFRKVMCYGYYIELMHNAPAACR